MDRVDPIKQVRDKLNNVGCGFCMKWLHETLYLHTGDNPSCIHQIQHISLEEIEKDP